MPNYKFRRGTVETVNLETRTLETWYTFKFTHPVEFRGYYGSVGGAWKWPTAAERNAALERMKRRAAQPASDGGEGAA